MEIDQPHEILEPIKEFIQKPFGFILFAGANGTGKTYAAQRIYENAQLRNVAWDQPLIEKFFMTQADLNIQWQEDVAREGNALYRLKLYRTSDLFVIDDLGTRTPTDAFMDYLYAIIDYRYNEKLPTIITTNLNSKMIRERFGDALLSRMASGIVLRFEGKDRRFKEF